jgi:hypothetical protein
MGHFKNKETFESNLKLSPQSMKGDVMKFVEKARIRMEHWVRHNLDHLEDYEAFAGELESAGKTECAWHIRAMGDLLSQSNDHLKEALRYLG